MAIVSDGKGVWEEPVAAATQEPDAKTDGAFTPYGSISPSATEYGSALSFYEPTSMLLRRSERAAHEDSDIFRSFLAGNANAYGANVTTEDLHEPSPTISADDANTRYSPPGTKLFDQPLPEKLAQDLGKTKAQQIAADSDIDRFEATHGIVTRGAIGAVAGLLDPINISTLFLPGLGEEAMAARFGESLLGRTLARGLAGASLGVVQQAPVEALKYGLGQTENDDYGIRRALSDTFSAAIFTAIPTMGFGALGDLFRGIVNKAHAPPPELKEEVDTVAPVVTADALTQDAARRTSVAQLVSGRPIDVDGFFPKPPATMTAISMFMDHPFLSHAVGESADIDRDTLARQLEPDMFGRYDDLAAKRDRLAGWYRELSDQQKAGFEAEAQAGRDRAAEIADLEYRLPRARQANLQKQIAGRLAELQAAAPPSVVKPSPGDLNLVQQQMLDTDYTMRDMAGKVSDAYGRADTMLARYALAKTGQQLDDISAQQRAFSSATLKPDLTSMLDREKAWRGSGVAPGISYQDLATASHELDQAAAVKPPVEVEPKVPDGFGAPEKSVAKEADEAKPVEGEAQPAQPTPEAATGEPKGPEIDTTGWLPEEKGELDGVNGEVDRAGLMAQAMEQAASCLAAGA